MNALAHGSGDWHDLWLTLAPFAVSAIVFLALHVRSARSGAVIVAEHVTPITKQRPPICNKPFAQMSMYQRQLPGSHNN